MCVCVQRYHVHGADWQMANVHTSLMFLISLSGMGGLVGILFSASSVDLAFWLSDKLFFSLTGLVSSALRLSCGGTMLGGGDK